MPTLVRFRFNKATGEVEEFLVDDQDRNLSEAEHDRIAADVGRFLVQSPRVIEVAPGRAAPVPVVLGEDREREGEGVSNGIPERE